MGVKAFVNDTLWGMAITDLDGYFIVYCRCVVDSLDKVEFEFHGPTGIYEERKVYPYDKSVIMVKHTLHDSITTKHLLKWRSQFHASWPNYLDTDPHGPLDDFVIKEKN